MEIKTIDEYILMEMREGSGEDVYTRAGECNTCEEYVVKKLVEMEERNEKLVNENWMLADKNRKLNNEITTLKEENETLKQENKALREAVKNCGKKITQVAKVLEDDLEPKSNNGAEASTISMKIDFNDDDDDDDNDDDEFDINDIDYDYFDIDDFDIDDLNDEDYGNLNYEDEED